MTRLDAIAKRTADDAPKRPDYFDLLFAARWQNDLLRAAERIIRAYMGDCDCDKTHEEHNRCMGHRWLAKAEAEE